MKGRVTQNLAKMLLSDYYRHRPSEYFTWMLESILRQVGLTIEGEPPEDARELVDKLVEAYEAEVAAAEPFTDILGPTYMEVASHGHQQVMGQYFTPFTITRMMAEMTIDGAPLEKPGGGLWRTCDPCSGSGAMMLAAAQSVLRRHGKVGLEHWSFTFVDLDRLCSLMSAVQFLANCLVHEFTLGEVLVLNGNSLLPWEGLTTVLHMSRADVAVAPAQHPARLEAIQAAAEQNLFPWYSEASNS